MLVILVVIIVELMVSSSLMQQWSRKWCKLLHLCRQIRCLNRFIHLPFPSICNWRLSSMLVNNGMNSEGKQILGNSMLTIPFEMKIIMKWSHWFHSPVKSTSVRPKNARISAEERSGEVEYTTIEKIEKNYNRNNPSIVRVALCHPFLLGIVTIQPK